MKRLCAHHSLIEIEIRLQRTAHAMRRNISAACERDVRMPGSQIGFQTDGDSCVAYALVQLEQVRMSTTNADPNKFRRIFWRKGSHARDRQKKSAEMNQTEFFAQF